MRTYGAGFSQEHAGKCAARLGISLPATVEQIKAAFKERAKVVHPDKGGSATEFAQLRDAYQYLLDNVKAYGPVEGAGMAKRTTQGDLLEELGKGLGPRVNSKACERCKGKGYSVESNPLYMSEREMDYKRRTEQLLYGRVVSYYLKPGARREPMLRYHTCYKCNGKGEVEVWNPVLRKMTIVSGKQQKKAKGGK